MSRMFCITRWDADSSTLVRGAWLTTNNGILAVIDHDGGEMHPVAVFNVGEWDKAYPVDEPLGIV